MLQLLQLRKYWRSTNCNISGMRCPTDLILSIDISTILQEVLSHLQVVVASSQMKRGGVAALQDTRTTLGHSSQVQHTVIPAT